MATPIDHSAHYEFPAATVHAALVDPEYWRARLAEVGPETVAVYAAEIRAAKTLLWNGPMGVFEMAPYASGTLTMAEELAEAADRGAFVLVGGGDSVAAVNKAGVGPRMSHVSTGGGASLEFLSGLDLPGVVALSK